MIRRERKRKFGAWRIVQAAICSANAMTTTEFRDALKCGELVAGDIVEACGTRFVILDDKTLEVLQ